MEPLTTPTRPGAANVVLASNRGPVSYALDEAGQLVPRRGGGGLVSGLSGAASGVWVCAALTEGDRLASRHVEGGRLQPADGASPAVHMLDIDPLTFDRAYSVVANSVLWFVQHQLFDAAYLPSFDERFARDWTSYEQYNGAFADAIASAAAPGAAVLVQDYHLTLVPQLLREQRPDLRISHFSHTPWATPDYFRILPEAVAAEVLTGMLGSDRVGFLTERWADAFLRCCAEVLGVPVDGRTVSYAGRSIVVDVHPLGVDGPGLRERAARPDVQARLSTLREQVGDRRCIVRIDRTELSKNILRGLEAYRELLRRYPQWVGQVVHVAFAYPSRHDLPAYREYTAAVQRAARAIIDEFGTAEWNPLLLHVEDDYPRSLAAYQLADVLLVNPVRDGMNLVAKEGPVLAAGGCVLVLSREAGAAAELGADALLVNPFDIVETTDALHAALLMSPLERRERCDRLTVAGTAMPPSAWFAAQLTALGVGSA